MISHCGRAIPADSGQCHGRRSCQQAPCCKRGSNTIENMYLFCCEVLQRRRMGSKDSDPSASVLDLGEDDLPGFSTAFDTVASGASEGDSDSGSEAGRAEQLLYWEVRAWSAQALHP